jgi:hypothetical protein
MNTITAVLASALALSGVGAPRLMAALLIAACAGGLAGCGEKLQRTAPESREAYNGPSGERPLHERTLLQGESSRMRD